MTVMIFLEYTRSWGPVIFLPVCGMATRLQDHNHY